MKCEARGKDIVGMGRGEGDTRRSGVGEKRKKGRRVLLPKIGEFDGRNHIWERKKTSRYHRVESLTLGVNAAEKEKLRTDAAGGITAGRATFLGGKELSKFWVKITAGDRLLFRHQVSRFSITSLFSISSFFDIRPTMVLSSANL